MKRLRDLDVHEVSIVGLGANGKKYLVLKRAKGATDMAMPVEKLTEMFAKIPKAKFEAITQVAKSAKLRVGKDDQGEVDEALQDPGMNEQDVQDALQAVGRILAPIADYLTPDLLMQLGEAVGMDPGSVDPDNDGDIDGTSDTDADAGTDDATAKADDGTAPDNVEEEGAPAVPQAKSDDTAEDSDAQVAANKADDSADQADDAEAAAKADDVAGDMPDFADATDADKEAALAAARTAYAQAMQQRNVGKATKNADGPGVGGDEQNKKEGTPGAASDVAKSALAGLAKLPAAQRAALEPIFKSQLARLQQVEDEHRQAVAKSAKLAEELKRREYVAKAAEQYPNLGPPEEIAGHLLALSKVDQGAVQAMEHILKAAQAQARAGGEQALFGELGTRNAGVVGDADQQIRTRVDGMVQKSAGAKTYAQMEAQFLSTPEGKLLYAQARRDAERRKG